MSSPTFNVKNRILRAGAGAGKTTTLTQTFLEFADQFQKAHQKFPHIVVTTFTRKATQELKERLLGKALEQGREDLFHYVSSKSQVQISTIHGVLSLYLSRYGSAMGFTPDFQIQSDFESRQTAKKILRKILLGSEQGQELLEEYDFKTLEECFLSYFANRFIYPEMRPISIEEMKSLVQADLLQQLQDLKSFCLAAVGACTHEKWSQYLQAWVDFKGPVVDESWNEFLDRLATFEDSNGKPPFRKATPPFDEGLHEEIDLARKGIKSFLVNPAHHAAFWSRHDLNVKSFAEFANAFHDEYLTSKLRSGLISMSDLELFSLKLMQDFPITAQNFSDEWDFWMIDEYQDTSPVQVRLLQSLVGKKPVFIVGDPQQSIYLFRGARSQVFQEKIDEIQAQDGEVEVKLVNYRSSPEVLEFFNHYFTRLSSQFSKMTPAPDKMAAPHAQAAVEIILNEGGEEDLSSFESMAAITRVQELLGLGVAPEQICILGRTHRTLEEMAKIAHEYGIPFQLHSGSGFYQRREILDALSILKFFMNPHDNPNLIALLRSPWLNLADSEILQICHGGSHSYWTESLKNASQLTNQHPIQILRSLLVEAEQAGLSATLKQALINLGCFDYTAAVDSSGRREANLWKLISLLSQEERRPGFNFLDFLDTNLSTLSTDEGGEDSDATPVIEPKRVNLMTVHASKGLQFEHVILPGMGQGPRASTIPMFSVRERDGLWTLKLRDPEDQTFVASSLAQHNNEELRALELQEFNRVLYVALTRAKLGVTLIWSSDFKNKSWAAEFPLNLDEGDHLEEGFKYRVRKQSPTPQKQEISPSQILNPRIPWQSSKQEKKWQSVSVTELAEGSTFTTPAKSVSQNMGAALARAQQGTDAHRLFEALKFNSLQTVLDISEEHLRDPLQFIARTELIPLMSIIEQGYVEWGFAFRHQKNLIQGQIDLWGVVNDVLWVVDYKTGSQKFSEMALKQLEIYAWALLKMNVAKNVKSISLAIVYPLEQVVKVREFASSAELSGPVESLLDKE